MSVTGNGQEGQSRSIGDMKYQEKGDWQMKKVLWICNIMLPAIARCPIQTGRDGYPEFMIRH